MTIALALLAMGAGQVSALPQEIPGTGVVITTDQFAGPVSWVWFTPEIQGLQDTGVLQYTVTCISDNSGTTCNGELNFRSGLGKAECTMTDDVVSGVIVLAITLQVDNCRDMDWTAPFVPTNPNLLPTCGGHGTAYGDYITGTGGGYGVGNC